MIIAKKENICIIPARGGSKRIPKKNLKYFYGKPIIYYAIKNAKKTNFFDKVVVSTENFKIAKYAKSQGAEIHMRSKKLAKDNVKLKSVVMNVIKDLEKKNFYYKKICCLFPTSIFFQSSELRLGFKKLKKNIILSLLLKSMIILFRDLFKKKEIYTRLVMINKNVENKNTQDFKPHYHDAAQFYLGQWRKSWFRIGKKKKISSKKENQGFIEMPKLHSQDIDNFDDWRIALTLWKLKKTK